MQLQKGYGDKPEFDNEASEQKYLSKYSSSS